MFDNLSSEPRDEALELARCFFIDHGHHIAAAAARLEGASGEARVISCALQIEKATRMTMNIRLSLEAIFRILSLSDHGDPECFDTEFFLALDPSSAEVEKICLLTDMLSDLLRDIEALRPRQHVGPATAGLLAV